MVKKIKLIIIGLIIGLNLATSQIATAAGSVVVSAESINSVQTGGTIDINFYATVSGANIGGVSFSVNLSNLSYQSYSAAGTAFNGYSGVPSGGSSAFQVAASYLGGGSSGRLFIGKITGLAGGTAGTGTVTVSNVSAVDNPNEEAMSGSSQNKSVTITAPPAPAPTCPAGQTGTPPNCTTPPPPAAAPTTPSNQTTQPNTSSTVAVPGTTKPAPNTESPKIVSEQVVADTYTDNSLSKEDSEATTQEVQTPEEDKASLDELFTPTTIIASIGGVAIVALATLALLKYMARRKASRDLNRHIVPMAAAITKLSEPSQDGVVILPTKEGADTLQDKDRERL